MDQTKILHQLGFSENKQAVYATALALGTATAAEIAKRSAIERTTAYKILGELIGNGLVEELAGKVKRFKALHPGALVALQEQNKDLAESLLPDLLGIFKSTSIKPRVRLYEGDDGFKKVFEDILTLKDTTVYTYSPMDNLIARFGKIYMRHFMERRVKRNVLRLNLSPATSKIKVNKVWELYGSDNKLMRDIRFLPPQIKVDTLIQIYGNKVAILASPKENYSFIIESPELFLLMKQTFAWMWQMARI